MKGMRNFRKKECLIRTPFELTCGYRRGIVDIREQYRCHKTLSIFRGKMGSIGAN
jgi:hypothetical protein